MAEVTQEGFEIAVYNTQTTKVAEIHFLKPSWLINVHGRISIPSLDHISQIMIDTFTLFHVDGSTNLFFIFDGRNSTTGGHGKCNAALTTATTSSSFRNPGVKKHSDNSDSGITGDSPDDQHANNNNNDTNLNNDAVVGPFVYAEHGETSGVKKDSSDDDDDEYAGNDGGQGNEIIEIETVRIHRIEVSINGKKDQKEILITDLLAMQYNSYQHFAAAIYHVCADINGLSHENAPAITDMTPFNCWPGAITSFGMYDGEEFLNFDWDRDVWDDVNMMITDVLVVTYNFLQYEGGNNGSQQEDDSAQPSNAGDAQHEAGGVDCIGNHKDFLINCAIGLAVFCCTIVGILIVFALTLLATS